MSEAESYYQERLLRGVMTKAFQLDYDVLIFTSFVKESFLKAVSVGEMQIYDVINYDKLDGVIVLADTLKMPGLFDKICRDIDEKCHVPVVFIDGSYKDYESIYTRDEKPFMQLTEHLIEAHGCRRIQYFLYLIIGQKRYYLCLNEDCLGEHEIVGEISTVPKEYTENMVLYIRNVDGKSRTLHDPFELKEIFPDLDEERESPCAFFITPVHFIDRCYGYAVLSYGDEIKSIDITYRNWTNHVSNALESMRIRNSIANLAVRDAMTGVYSRIGIEKNIQFVIDRMSDPKNKAFIAVCDLDCLKKINDNFGHNSGDIAIKAIADAVLASTKNHEICARVGGDEFVVIGCNDYNDNYPERFSARVNDRLRVYKKFAGNEFEVSVSIGGICKHITDIHELEDMFTQADKIMYASKLERHKNRK